LAEIDDAAIGPHGVEQLRQTTLRWPSLIVVAPPALLLGGPLRWPGFTILNRRRRFAGHGVARVLGLGHVVHPVAVHRSYSLGIKTDPQTLGLLKEAERYTRAANQKKLAASAGVLIDGVKDGT
jgi:hypothetical protein